MVGIKAIVFSLISPKCSEYCKTEEWVVMNIPQFIHRCPDVGHYIRMNTKNIEETALKHKCDCFCPLSSLKCN